MASVLSFKPSLLRPNSTRSGHRKSAISGSHRRKASSPSWWTPIFGWPSEPDYISGDDDVTSDITVSDAEDDPTRFQSRFAPGCFTADKAKQLRMKTMESETFHDIMYHSAIASRLASDLSDRHK